VSNIGGDWPEICTFMTDTGNGFSIVTTFGGDIVECLRAGRANLREGPEAASVSGVFTLPRKESPLSGRLPLPETEGSGSFTGNVKKSLRIVKKCFIILKI